MRLPRTELYLDRASVTQTSFTLRGVGQAGHSNSCSASDCNASEERWLLTNSRQQLARTLRAHIDKDSAASSQYPRGRDCAVNAVIAKSAACSLFSLGNTLFAHRPCSTVNSKCICASL